MKKKFVYLVKRGDFYAPNNRFDFWNNTIFSSKDKAFSSVQNSIEVNKGYDVVVSEPNSLWLQCTDFKTTSTDGQIMIIRLIVEKIEVR